MPGYTTRNIALSVGELPFRLRVLTDRQQFSDPDGHGERLGISSAQWSLFGQLWPAGCMLARAMLAFDIEGKRILELGCGIGLPSLVLQQRGADVVASDIHPLAESFLAYNAAFNDLPAVHYRQFCWNNALPNLGRFDLIIGSDLLYETTQSALLDGVISRHAQPDAEIVITDPGRGNSQRFTRAVAAQGFSVTESRSAMDEDDVPPYRGRLLHYRRGTPRNTHVRA